MSSNYPPGVTGREDYFYPPDPPQCEECGEEMEYDKGQFWCPNDHGPVDAEDAFTQPERDWDASGVDQF